jgi:AAA family ATP:ADP antiporter
MINTSHAVEVEPSSGIHRWISVLVPIKRSELLTVAVLTVNVFVLLTCYYVLKVVREPLILLGGGAELKAYAGAGQAVLLLGVVPAFGWLSSRVHRLRLLTIVQLVFIGCLVAFYALAHAHAPIGLAFYLWLGIFNVLVVSNFWSFANDLYTEEQGKRLFAIIGVGASVGAIIGAFLPHVLHRVVGAYALMLVAAAGLGLSIVLYRIADVQARRRRTGATGEPPRAVSEGEPDEPAHEAKLGQSGGFALVLKDRYLRLLAAMLLTGMVINTTGEYVISKMATERSAAYAKAQVADAPAATPAPAASTAPAPDAHKAVDKAQGDYLSQFFSDYYGLVNLLSFLIQALLVARIMTRLGVRRALFIMPLVVLGGWFALLIFTNMTAVRIEKTAENSLDYSLNSTLRHALFLPTPREYKYKAKAAIDTFVWRLGDVIAGLGIVFLFTEVLHLDTRAFAALNVVLALCWLVLASRAGRLHDELAAAQASRDSTGT